MLHCSTLYGTYYIRFYQEERRWKSISRMEFYAFHGCPLASLSLAPRKTSLLHCCGIQTYIPYRTFLKGPLEKIKDDDVVGWSRMDQQSGFECTADRRIGFGGENAKREAPWNPLYSVLVRTE